MPNGYFGGSPPLVRDMLLVQPRTVAELDFRSPIVGHKNGNVVGSPALVGIPSMYQPFPTTADALLRLLGDGEYPSGWSPSDVLAIYTFNSAGNLVDLTGQQPALVPYNSPMTLRELVGLFGPARVGGETERASLQRWAHANTSRFPAVPPGGVRSYVVVVHGDAGKTATDSLVCGTYNWPHPWLWYTGLGDGGAIGYPPVPAGYTVRVSGAAVESLAEFSTRAWVALAAVVSSTGTTYQAVVRTPTGTSRVSGPASGSAWNDWWFGLPVPRPYESGDLTGARQYAYMFCVAKEITSAHLARLARHGALRRDCSYVHDGEIVVLVGEGRICGYAKNQAVVGYTGALVSEDNPGGLGLQLFAAGPRMLGVYGGDIHGGWSAINATKTLTDGPSGMRDAAAVTALSYGTPPYYGHIFTTRSISALGPSDTTWRVDAFLRASSGTAPWVRVELLFTGDPHGNESIVAYAGSPTVGGDWIRIGGTAAPTRGRHTTIYVIVHVQDTTQPTIQLSDVTVAWNWSSQPAEWCALSHFDDYVRPASLTAGSPSAPWLRFDRGRVELSHVRGGNTGNAALIHLGSDGLSQVIVWYGPSGDLYARIRDASGKIVWTASVPDSSLPPGKRTISLEWDAHAGYGRLELLGATGWITLAGYRKKPWTPGTGGDTVSIGSVSGGTTWPFVGWIERVACYDRPRRR